MILRRLSTIKTITKSFITLGLILTIKSAVGQDYYWVGNSGNWTDLSHWATSSGGGTFHAVVPTAANNVYFDANSFSSASQTLTINALASCKSLNWTGVINSPTMSLTSDLSIDGSLTFVAGMSLSGNGTIRFTSSGNGNTVKTSGRLPRNVSFEGSGDWTLQDALTATSYLYLTMGTLTTNNNPVTTNYFSSSDSDLTRQLNLGSSVVTCSDWNLANNTNLTLNAGTSSITVSFFFAGGGYTYNNVTLDGIYGYVYNSNTFNNLAIDAGASVFIEEGNTQSVTQLQATGDCAHFINIQTITAGNSTTISKPSGTVNLSRVKLTDIVATGGATFNATNYIDGGNNTGWTTTELTGTTYYWVGNAGNWSDPNHWSLASGGSASGCLPTQVDNVVFDAQSFASAGQTVNVDDLNTNCLSMNWSGVTNSPDLDGTRDINIYGSLTLAVAMTVSYGGVIDITFRSNNTGNTISTAGHVLDCYVRFDGSGEWTLQDDIVLNTGNLRRFYMDKGSLSTNNHDITAYSFNATTGLTRQLMLGSSTITCGNQWNLFDETNLTFDAGTSTIVVGSSGTFYGAGLTYHNVQMNSDQTIIVEGSNTFNQLSILNSERINFTEGTTQSLNILSIPAGTGCTDFTTVSSTNPGFPATISMPGASTFNGDYLIISDVIATGGTFNATNSIGVGDVSGWNITSFTGQNFYWIGGTGSWNDPTQWSLTSGGSPGNCLPTLVDNVFFDSNSFTAPGQFVNMNAKAYCKSMDWTGATFNPELSAGGKLNINGSLTLIPEMQMDYTGALTFLSPGPGNVIATAGQPLNSSIHFDGTGEYSLQDDLESSGELDFRQGTLNTNNSNITIGGDFRSFYALTRNLNLGSSKITIDNWGIADATNLTFDAGTSEIIYTPGGSEFQGAGLTYSDVTIQGFNAVSLLGSNTFNILTLEPGVTLSLDASSTQTVSRLLAKGTSERITNLLTTSTGVTATISQSTPNFCGDYLTIRDIVASGMVPFYAGTNSTDLGNNTGWSFTNCAPPVADAGADDTICLAESLPIGGSPTASGATGPYTYSWSPTAGLDDPTVANPAASPTTTTTYTVTVIDYLSAQGTDMITITVNPLPTANAGADAALCAGESIQLNATGGVSYAWSPTASLDDSTSANPAATVSTTTVYTVTVTGENGCSATDNVTIMADTPVIANAGLDVAICQGNGVTLNGSGGVLYLWSPTTGLSNPSIAGPLATPAAATEYELTVSNGECSDADQVVVTVNGNPVADAGTDAEICALQSMLIGGVSTGSGGTGPYTFAWSPAAFVNNNSLANPSATPTGTTQFVVTVYDANGCSDTDVMTFTVNPLPTADAGAEDTVCPSTVASLGSSPTGSGGTPPYTFSWSPANLVNNSSLANPTATPSATTNFTVSVTDAKGCTSSDLMTLTIDNLMPQAAFTYSETGPGAYTFTDTSTDPISWLWDFSDGNNSTNQSPIHSYANNGMYEVCLTVASACFEDTSCETIDAIVTGIDEIREGGVAIYPNPAQHEFFLILNSTEAGNVELVILNTKGQPVFKHSREIGPGPSSFNVKTADWPTGIYLINMRVHDKEIPKSILIHKTK